LFWAGREEPIYFIVLLTIMLKRKREVSVIAIKFHATPTPIDQPGETSCPIERRTKHMEEKIPDISFTQSVTLAAFGTEGTVAEYRI
jgi:hypothetical protein